MACEWDREPAATTKGGLDAATSGDLRDPDARLARVVAGRSDAEVRTGPALGESAVGEHRPYPGRGHVPVHHEPEHRPHPARLRLAPGRTVLRQVRDPL